MLPPALGKWIPENCSQLLFISASCSVNATKRITANKFDDVMITGKCKRYVNIDRKPLFHLVEAVDEER